MKIKMGPRKCILKVLKEIQPKENVILGNYNVEANGSLQNLHPNVLESASTAEEPSSLSEKSSVQCSQMSDHTEAGPSRPTTTSQPLADSFSRYGTVREALIKHPQGTAVLKAAESGFSEENRRSLIRIVVSELIKVHDSYYPPERAKIALAIAIVEEFPLLKDKKSTKGYEHYYDSISKKGFIEYRLWTVRKNLTPSKKKYNNSDRRKKITNGKRACFSTNKLKLLPKEELDEKISWMKCKNPTENNKPAIISCLNDTLANRRKWITEKSPTISEIFDEYPRLLDYKGEMIDLEFENMFEGATNNFLARFPSYYSPRILAYSSTHRPDLYKLTSHIDNVHLRALIILVQLLPVSNAVQKKRVSNQTSAGTKRTRKQRMTEQEADDPDEEDLTDVATLVRAAEIPNRCLIQIVREGENLPQLERNTRRESNANVQPYMICVRGQRNETFMVQGDGWFLDIHNNSNAMIAFDVLFKCYYALNVSYPTSLQNFYNFMESYVYKIESQTQSIVSSVHVNIANTKLTSDEENMRNRGRCSDYQES